MYGGATSKEQNNVGKVVSDAVREQGEKQQSAFSKLSGTFTSLLGGKKKTGSEIVAEENKRMSMYAAGNKVKSVAAKAAGFDWASIGGILKQAMISIAGFLFLYFSGDQFKAKLKHVITAPFVNLKNHVVEWWTGVKQGFSEGFTNGIANLFIQTKESLGKIAGDFWGVTKVVGGILIGLKLFLGKLFPLGKLVKFGAKSALVLMKSGGSLLKGGLNLLKNGGVGKAVNAITSKVGGLFKGGSKLFGKTAKAVLGKAGGVATMLWDAGKTALDINKHGLVGTGDLYEKEAQEASFFENALDALNPMKMGFAVEAMTGKALNYFLGPKGAKKDSKKENNVTESTNNKKEPVAQTVSSDKTTAPKTLQNKEAVVQGDKVDSAQTTVETTVVTPLAPKPVAPQAATPPKTAEMKEAEIARQKEEASKFSKMKDIDKLVYKFDQLIDIVKERQMTIVNNRPFGSNVA